MSREDVVLLHGIWMPAAEMQFVRHRLEQEHGFRGHLFGYASVRATLDQNARRLAAFLTRLDADRVHLVGHSLGGVLALRMLVLGTEVMVGRVVCLGSPLGGSEAGRRLRRHAWGRAILGHTITAGVIDTAAADWAADVTRRYDVGVIAGTKAMGLGRLFVDFDEPSDGTVAVAETRLPGLRDHVCLPVSHTGLALSAEVADQAAAFLRRGEFLRRGGTQAPSSPASSRRR